jgi:DNA-directed RNA polymerase specialized sigma24 family protein
MEAFRALPEAEKKAKKEDMKARRDFFRNLSQSEKEALKAQMQGLSREERKAIREKYYQTYSGQ